MSFLRTFKQLLPSGAAWRLTIEKTLRSFFEGLTGAPEDARSFLDDVHDDLDPQRTRALALWERQFALLGAADETARRTALDGRWKETGGQSPRYLQDVVQAAGFPLYIHEWWEPGGPPYVARDPRDHTDDPTIGTVQCGEPLAQCGESGALANAFLANWPGYYVNLDLTPRPPPFIPDDSDTWPFFLYWGGETFGDVVDVLADRRAELETLLLRICPAHLWLVVMVRWVDASGERVTLAGDVRVTLGGDRRVTLGV